MYHRVCDSLELHMQCIYLPFAAECLAQEVCIVFFQSADNSYRALNPDINNHLPEIVRASEIRVVSIFGPFKQMFWTLGTLRALTMMCYHECTTNIERTGTHCILSPSFARCAAAGTLSIIPCLHTPCLAHFTGWSMEQ